MNIDDDRIYAFSGQILIFFVEIQAMFIGF